MRSDSSTASWVEPRRARRALKWVGRVSAARGVATVAVLGLAWGGCASVPMAPREVDAAAKQFAPPPGKANLYVFRPAQFKGSAIVLQVRVDQSALGRTKAGTFLYAPVAPGQYLVTSQSEEERPVILRAEEGVNYFFEQAIQFGWLEARSSLLAVDEVTGRQAVRATTMAASQAPPPARPSPSPPGCTKDTDCKGDRVCNAGACVEPPAPR